MQFGDEHNPSKKEATGPFKVAQKVTAGRREKNNCKEFDLRELKSEQIRQFAMNLGCARVGSKSKFLCRKEIALRIDLGIICDQVNAPSVRTTATERRLNALLRIVNACFLPRNVNDLIELNDTKKRAEHKDAKSTNPLKDFWITTSDNVNDSEDQQLLLLLHNTIKEDPHIPSFECNLSDFNAQSHSACETNLSDLMRCRQKLWEKKMSSGNHANNSWTHIWGKICKPRKSVEMPKEAICHLDKHCSIHTDIDKAFTEALTDRNRSDSSKPLPPIDSNEVKIAAAASANKTKEEFLAAIKQSSDDMKAGRDEASQQREELVRATLWNQCTSLSRECWKLKEGNDNPRLLKNLTKRLLSLKQKLEIEDTAIDQVDLPAATSQITPLEFISLLS